MKYALDDAPITELSRPFVAAEACSEIGLERSTTQRGRPWFARWLKLTTRWLAARRPPRTPADD